MKNIRTYLGFTSLFFTLLISTTPSIAAQNTTKSLLEDYKNFLNSGCPVSTLLTPIETRVLKNIAFAKHGYKFKSKDLTFLYKNNGDWYKPNTSSIPKLPAKEQSCVDQLAKRESTLKTKLRIDPEIKEVLTRSSKLYFWMRKHLHQNPAKFVTQSTGRKTKNSWSWYLIDKSSCGGSGTPEEQKDCSGVAFMCELPAGTTDWKLLKCIGSWAG